MDEYLSKPLQVNRVFQLIEFLVSKKKKQTAPLPTLPVKKEQVDVQVLDTERALPIFGNDMALYKELFGEFIHSLPEKLSQLREDLNNDDLKALSLHAHNLKGLSANFGAMQLSGLAATLDTQCKDGQHELVTDTLLNLSLSMDELRSKAFDILEPMKKTSQEI